MEIVLKMPSVKENNKPPCLKGQKDEDYGVSMVCSCCVSFQAKYWKVENAGHMGGCQLFEDLICRIYSIIAFT
jgi:hypothetical protein